VPIHSDDWRATSARTDRPSRKQLRRPQAKDEERPGLTS
jgi:hypothetical protein